MYIERIALEQYNYLEIHADTLEDLQKRVAEAKVAYANRLFKAPVPDLTNAHTPAQFAKALNNVCAVCGQEMQLVPAGISKKTGRPYNSFYACKIKEHKQPR